MHLIYYSTNNNHYIFIIYTAAIDNICDEITVNKQTKLLLSPNASDLLKWRCRRLFKIYFEVSKEVYFYFEANKFYKTFQVSGTTTNTS